MSARGGGRVELLVYDVEPRPVTPKAAVPQQRRRITKYYRSLIAYGEASAIHCFTRAGHPH
eukprot:9525578-Prorocentrum_lima.AAC.1